MKESRNVDFIRKRLLSRDEIGIIFATNLLEIKFFQRNYYVRASCRTLRGGMVDSNAKRETPFKICQ